MEKLKDDMFDEAIQKYGYITLCGNAKDWEECFTEEDGYLMFWFNVGRDTKMIRRLIS